MKAIQRTNNIYKALKNQLMKCKKRRIRLSYNTSNYNMNYKK